MQVLQRKTEEAAAATKRLKEILEARKSTKENTSNGMHLRFSDNVLTDKNIQMHHICNSYDRHVLMVVSSSHCNVFNLVGLSSSSTNKI